MLKIRELRRKEDGESCRGEEEQRRGWDEIKGGMNRARGWKEGERRFETIGNIFTLLFACGNE